MGDVLDKVDMFDDFDPRRDYKLTVGDAEMLDVERNVERGGSIDDIDLDLSGGP